VTALELVTRERHEAVHLFQDRTTGVRFIVAIHSTVRGPAVGGCRMWPYANLDAALGDALRLSKGMSYKAALAGLPYGGGKSVVIGDPHTDKTRELLAVIGRAVDSLGGRYTVSDDVGIGAADVAVIAESTRFACAPLLADGRAAPATAFGTFQGIRAVAAHVFGSDALAGRSIAVQGLGAVGWQLCAYLAEAGARLYVTDLDGSLARAAAERWGAVPVATDVILEQPVDVLAPCALGGILNSGTVPRLRCRAIAGAANNQLAAAADGRALAARGIAYAPDYAINVGGLVDLVHALRPGYDVAAVLDDCRAIFDRTRMILEEAARSGEAPSVVADRLAEARLAQR
jgi:leucine dehydrogenase